MIKEKRKFLYAFIETEKSHLTNYLSENGKVEGMVLSYDFEVTKDRDKICIKEILQDSIKIRDHSRSMMDVRVRHVRGSQDVREVRVIVQHCEQHMSQKNHSSCVTLQGMGQVSVVPQGL